MLWLVYFLTVPSLLNAGGINRFVHESQLEPDFGPEVNFGGGNVWELILDLRLSKNRPGGRNTSSISYMYELGIPGCIPSTNIPYRS